MSVVAFCPHNPDELCDCKVDECPCCGGLGVAMQCPGCDGQGAVQTRSKRNAELAHQPQFERCTVCKGRGWFPISAELYDRMGFKRPSLADFVYRRKPVQRSA